VTQPKKEVDENHETDWSSDEEDLPEVPVASKPKPSGKGKGQSFRNIWMFWLEAVMSVIYTGLITSANAVVKPRSSALDSQQPRQLQLSASSSYMYGNNINVKMFWEICWLEVMSFYLLD